MLRRRQSVHLTAPPEQPPCIYRRSARRPALVPAQALVLAEPVPVQALPRAAGLVLVLALVLALPPLGLPRLPALSFLEVPVVLLAVAPMGEALLGASREPLPRLP